MPKPVQGGAFSRALSRVFATQGKVSLFLDEIIIPTVQIADLSDEAEGLPAQGEIRVPAGGAGMRSFIHLSLPESIGAVGHELRILDMWVYSNTASMTLFWGLSSSGLPSPNVTGQKRWRDSGLGGFPTGVLQGRNNAGIPVGIQTQGVLPLAVGEAQYIKLDMHVVAGDTNGFIVWCGSDNQELRATIRWLEIQPR